MRVILVLGLALACGCSAVGPGGKAIQEAKKLVAEELIDGRSAQFENVVYSPAQFNNPEMVCGWVNAKNRLGAFVGAEQFLVSDGRVRMLGVRRDDGLGGEFGACVAGNKAASDRLFRDVDRSLEAYRDAVKAAS